MGDITVLLARARDNDRAASDALFELLYDDLRRLARSRLAHSGHQTLLNTSALVHEAYLRFQQAGRISLHDREHFLAYAATTLRSVVVDFVRKRSAERRGGYAVHVTLDTGVADEAVASDDEILAVHEALEEPAAESPPAASATDDADHDGIVNEVPVSLVDYLEFYLLNYFKPAAYKQTTAVQLGRRQFERIGCTGCHVPDLTIERDRRVADVETVYDPVRGHFNNLFATATPMFNAVSDGTTYPPLKQAKLLPFQVRGIFADLKRHDVGSGFYERNYDGTIRREFMTTPLWGVGSTAPYGHDGRSINLAEVILRHGGEAQEARDAFAKLSDAQQSSVLDFLNSLVLFPPDDRRRISTRATPTPRAFRNTDTAASGCKGSSTIRPIRSEARGCRTRKRAVV